MEEVLVTEVESRPKRQKLITDFHQQVIKEEEVQHNLPMEAVMDLRDKMLEEKMVKRGIKAMQRSLRKKKEARDRYHKYTNHYGYLSKIGDKEMFKAWREANKTRENWMEPERPEMILEEVEPQEDPPEPPEEATGPEPQGVQETCQGKMRKLTDFYNKLGRPITAKAPGAPKTPVKAPSSPSGGVKKTKRRGKPKLEEPQRLKLELAMRNFLKKKPPDK